MNKKNKGTPALGGEKERSLKMANAERKLWKEFPSNPYSDLGGGQKQ